MKDRESGNLEGHRQEEEVIKETGNTKRGKIDTGKQRKEGRRNQQRERERETQRVFSRHEFA